VVGVPRPEHRPSTGRACRPITMVACFHCSNCLITEEHLPTITALTAALNRRRTTLSEQDWCWRCPANCS
jgi:hypothetical protein